MNVEQRLIEAFQTSAHAEPTPDLFSRVVHSIEEDRRHRQRIVRTAAVVAASLIAVIVAGALSLERSPSSRWVDRPTMEILEVVTLVVLLLVLGPAIRRFGRGYAADLWPAGATTPAALLRLLDVAYYLVGAGYILLSTEFQFGTFDNMLAEQLSDASIRIGGLLLTLGLLHATTFFALPMLAMIDNCTRTGTRLPRWVILVLVVIGLNIVPIAEAAIGIALVGSSGG